MVVFHLALISIFWKLIQTTTWSTQNLLTIILVVLVCVVHGLLHLPLIVVIGYLCVVIEASAVEIGILVVS